MLPTIQGLWRIFSQILYQKRVTARLPISIDIPNMLSHEWHLKHLSKSLTWSMYSFPFLHGTQCLLTSVGQLVFLTKPVQTEKQEFRFATPLDRSHQL